MVNLLIAYTFTKGGMAPFLDGIKESNIADLTRHESGCLRYDYYTVMGDSKLYLWEAWYDEEALEEHRSTPHYIDLIALKTMYVVETSVKKFESLYL